MFRPNRILPVLVALFALLLLTQLGTGVLLFILNWGTSLSEIQQHYMGPDGQTPLSSIRLLETALPHILAMGVSGFILAHFLAFCENLRPRTKVWLSGSLFLSIFVNIGADFVIVLWPILAWLKPLTFVTLQGLFASIIFLILKSTLASPQLQSVVKSRKT